MSDGLDTKTDRELNELFAREVSQWKKGEEVKGAYPQYWYSTDGKTVTALSDFNLPTFTTDANAVLPWMEKHGDADITMTKHCGRVGYVVSINRDQRAVAPTFARAAVIALIRSKRAEKS